MEIISYSLRELLLCEENIIPTRFFYCREGGEGSGASGVLVPPGRNTFVLSPKGEFSLEEDGNCKNYKFNTFCDFSENHPNIWKTIGLAHVFSPGGGDNLIQLFS